MTSAKSFVKAVNYTKLFKPKHFNKWVALNNEKSKVLAYGKSPKEVLKNAAKVGEKDPVITIALRNYYGFIT